MRLRLSSRISLHLCFVCPTGSGQIVPILPFSPLNHFCTFFDMFDSVWQFFPLLLIFKNSVSLFVFSCEKNIWGEIYPLKFLRIQYCLQLAQCCAEISVFILHIRNFTHIEQQLLISPSFLLRPTTPFCFVLWWIWLLDNSCKWIV